MIFKEGEVEAVLLRLHIEPDTFRGDEILALCPGHEGRTGRRDNNPSWSVNTESGVHHCFSCGFKGSLLTLVAEVLQLKTDWDRLDLDAAKAWLRKHTDVDLEALAKQLSEMKDAYIAITKPVGMSEARLAIFDDAPDWALKARGLTAESAAAYGVRYKLDGDQWITPIRDEAGKLMGWQEKGQLDRHFFNRPAGIQKSRSLFGLNAWQSGTMIVVESPLDAVRIHSVGIPGAVATYGALVSDEQLNMMRRADRLIFALDNPRVDDAGAKALRDLVKRTRTMGMECRFFDYQHTRAKDPGDMTPKEIEQGVNKARHMAYGAGLLMAMG